MVARRTKDEGALERCARLIRESGEKGEGEGDRVRGKLEGG